jgi:hypothetical protein
MMTRLPSPAPTVLGVLCAGTLGGIVEELASELGRATGLRTRLELTRSGIISPSWPGLTRPSTSCLSRRKTWMPATSAGMTMSSNRDLLCRAALLHRLGIGAELSGMHPA